MAILIKIAFKLEYTRIHKFTKRKDSKIFVANQKKGAADQTVVVEILNCESAVKFFFQAKKKNGSKIANDRKFKFKFDGV